MHQENIQALREEVLRLLQAQFSFLTDLSTMLADETSSEGGDLPRGLVDEARARDWLLTCESELAKVERLEMTLAVVGTMKAGKSTTINAIVGTEVLPNRNRPMTSLPTLIRHVPGQLVPRLTFPAPGPLIQALENIKAKLQTYKNDDRLDDVPFYASSPEGRRLVEAILADAAPSLTANYEGPEGIFDFLEFINDITRLCRDEAIDVESPVSEYDSIEEFPVIEVEFYHLRHAKGGELGKFTLVDTPGPNEAGQSERLTRILQQQLEQASAVLAVLDYTQLGSKADDEVRQELKKIAQRSGDHLFVLVNKFDEADRNGMKFEEIPTYVVERLLDGTDLGLDRVYPVSSKAAYLANRALATLDNQGGLPESNGEDWVADFGDVALGKRWERQIDQVDIVREAATELWNDGFFEKPLEDVIVKSHSRAALNSIESAVTKMRDYNVTSQQMLNLQANALTMSVEDVARQIGGLKEDIQKVHDARELAGVRLERAVNEFTDRSNALFREGAKKIEEELNRLFRAEKTLEVQRAAAEAENSVEPLSFANVFAMMFRTPPKGAKDLGIEPNGPNRFESESEAKAFRKKLMNVVDSMIEEWTSKAQGATQDELKRVEKDLISGINVLVAPVLKDAAERLSRGFDAELKFPVPKADQFEVNFSTLSRGENIEERSQTRTRYRTERRWYTLWMKEHRVAFEVTEQYYLVDVRKIGREVLIGLEGERIKIEENLVAFAQDVLRESANQYIEDLADYLEQFRGELDKSRYSLEHKGERLGAFRQVIGTLRSRASEQGGDIEQVVKGLDAADAVVLV